MNFNDIVNNNLYLCGILSVLFSVIIFFLNRSEEKNKKSNKIMYYAKIALVSFVVLYGLLHFKGKNTNKLLSGGGSNGLVIEDLNLGEPNF